MSTSAELIFEKLKSLPLRRVAEVEDFVDFLAQRDEGAYDAASQRLGESMAKLDALALPEMTADEIQEEIALARAARRGASNADRR